MRYTKKSERDKEHISIGVYRGRRIDYELHRTRASQRSDENIIPEALWVIEIH